MRCLLACLLLLPLTVAAQDGELDPSFGAEGRVVTDLGGDDELFALALEPDGAILAAGSMTDNAGNEDFAIARYRSDGTRDLAFGDGGVATFDFGGPYGDEARVVASLADGYILVGGFTRGGGAGSVLLRLTPEGRLDPTFGDGGIVEVPSYSTLYDLVVLDDGRFVVGGSGQATDGEDTQVGFALSRYLPDGQLDPTFGDSGRVTTLFSYAALGLDLDVLPDGRLLMTGYELDFDLFYLALARYLPHGELDPTFSEDGKYSFPDWQTVGIDALALEDGRLLVVGTDLGDTLLWRFLSDGQLDPAFGNGGSMEVRYGSSGLGSPGAALDDAGRLLIQARPGIAVARFSTDGVRDTDFGVNGFAQAFSSTADFPRTLLLQPDDGSILIGGSGPGVAGGMDFKLARFLTEPPSTDNQAPPSPAALRLDAFPNPAASASTVTFALPTSTDVTLNVFDLLGRRVATLAEGTRAAGTHHVTWTPTGLPNGVYTARLEAGDAVRTQRLVLTR